jgi:PAS domain S-box-containing protein
MLIPVIRDGLVVSILGVGNKTTIYTKTDQELVMKLADLVWDIVEKKRVEIEFEKNQIIFNAFMENSPIYVFFKDKDIRSLILSRNYEKMLGKPLDQLIGKTMNDLFPSDFAKKMILDDQSILKENKTVTIDEELNGRSYTTVKFPIKINESEKYLAGYTIDVTDQKLAEQRLVESEEKYRSFFEQATIGVVLTDLSTGKYLRVNKKYCEFLGYTEVELLNKSFQEVTYPADLDANLQLNEKLKEKKIREFTIEKRYLRKDGSIVWGKLTSNLLNTVSSEKNTIYQISVLEDITQQKQAELERQVLLEILEGATTTNDLHEFLKLIHNALKKVLYANNISIVVMDKSSGLFHEVYTVDEFDPPMEPSKLERTITSYIFRTRKPVLLEQDGFEKLKDSGEVDLVGAKFASFLGAPLETPSGIIGVLTVQNYNDKNSYSAHDKEFLTTIGAQVAQAIERKRSEELIRQKDELIRISGNMANIGGWEFDTVTGEGTWTDVVARIHDLDPNIPTNVQIGTSFYTADSKLKIESAIDRAIKFKESYDLELELISAKKIHRWVRTVGIPVVEDGKVVKIRGFFQDITDRKKIELSIAQLNAELEKRVEERTKELQLKNRELETFSYSVSHDLKAPLRGIAGYSGLLLEDHSKQLDQEGKDYLNKLVASTNRMERLIEDLLTYSREERRPLIKTSFSLHELVDLLLEEHAVEIKTRHVIIEKQVENVILTTDQDALSFVIRNVLDNALKFTSHEENPKISILCRSEKDQEVVSIHDNGIGFDMKYHDKIFQIFQRLNLSEDYPGTGVGLAIARKSIERLGGTIWAESEPGSGTTFFISIPR